MIWFFWFFLYRPKPRTISHKKNIKKKFLIPVFFIITYSRAALTLFIGRFLAEEYNKERWVSTLIRTQAYLFFLYMLYSYSHLSRLSIN